ncbi:hypothetical protein BKI52_45180 [marine bacterium AO1-C]|nr:hypothetical protein BKI52_45180 [marine bacterium AO1-C]
MRIFTITLLLLGFGYFAQAQKTVTASEARTRVGDYLTIKGKVAQVSIRKKVCYLNFTHKFPNNEFVAVVFKENFGKFGNLRKFEGKTVKLTGKVSRYRGNPQIKLNDPRKIKIVE